MSVIDLGRYLVFDEIASGGMSSVHFGRMVTAAGFGRTVAIKRLHQQYAEDPAFVSMMLNEARVVSRIHHPNVVPMLDVVPMKADLFLVLEYVPGETLSRLQALAVDQGVSIPESVALAIMTGVLLGLDAAHDATSEEGEPLHIVHRDVSPQNVIVGIDGNARLLDFGVARGRSHRSEGGYLKGKIAYMSPEQLRLDPDLNRASDIYAASVVLWEMLAGRRLFDRLEKAQIIPLILAGAIRSPRTVTPAVSEALEDVVMRGLDPSPERRFATAREMATALESCGRIATAREVASLVTSIAAAPLADRSTIVARIEKETASRVDVGAIASKIAEGKHDQAEATSPPAPIGVLPGFGDDGPTERMATHERSSRRVILAAAGVACLLGVALAWRHFAHARSRANAGPPLAVSSESAPASAALPTQLAPVAFGTPALAPRATESAEPSPSGAAASAKVRRRDVPVAHGKPRTVPTIPSPSNTTSTNGHDLFDRN